MQRITWLALLACGAFIGCDQPTQPEGNVGAPPASSKAEPGGAEKVPADADVSKDKPAAADTDAAKDKTSALTPEEIDNVKKLPEADAKLALAQQVCPVSGEHLGSMDTPIKVEFEGKAAFLCCDSCKDGFDKEPAKYLAKLAESK